MRRDLERLAGGAFDVAVVGGGIMGLALAREAAERGLLTALVDKGDFGGATSANSLKLIHGGLRYLQHGDVGRLRQSVRERLAFMRTAPHLVHPLPFLVPTYGHAAKGPEAMRAAFVLYGCLAWDRNRSGDPEKTIPPGAVLSAAETLRLFPGFRREGLSGGAQFHDGQACNSERLALSVALAADRAGAALANYVRAEGFLTDGGRVAGLKVRDLLGGGDFDLRAKVVVNAAGPWADELLQLHPARPAGSGYLLAKAVNLVVPRLLCPTHAVGLECRERSDSLVGRGGRLFFITPWKGASLIGTTYHTWSDAPDSLRTAAADVEEIVGAINGAWPEAGLSPDEVTFLHVGLVPITAPTGPAGANLAKADRVLDHARDGVEGLVSLVGVKYTTARDLAQKTADLVFRKLGRPVPPSRTALTPLPGGDTGPFLAFLEASVRGRPAALPEATARRLAHDHGTRTRALLALAAEERNGFETLPGSDIIRAEVVQAVREEMAISLADVVLRRTGLGQLGSPGEPALAACADLVAAELGWDAERKARELDGTRAALAVPR